MLYDLFARTQGSDFGKGCFEIRRVSERRNRGSDARVLNFSSYLEPIFSPQKGLENPRRVVRLQDSDLYTVGVNYPIAKRYVELQIEGDNVTYFKPFGLSGSEVDSSVEIL